MSSGQRHRSTRSAVQRKNDVPALLGGGSGVEGPSGLADRGGAFIGTAQKSGYRRKCNSFEASRIDSIMGFAVE